MIFSAGFACVIIYIYIMRDITSKNNISPQSLLPCHDDLRGTLETALSLLERAAIDRKSPLHTPVLSTLGLDNTPQTRIVVLRETNIQQRNLEFHTDTRSTKISEIKASPQVSLLFYDPKKKIQLKVSGTAKLQSDQARQAAWERLHRGSQAVYQIEPAPSTPLTNPQKASYSPDINQQGYAHFSAITVTMNTLEWLYLAAAGHRRAWFDFQKSGVNTSPQMQWLAP